MQTRKLLVLLVFVTLTLFQGAYANAMDHDGGSESAEEGALRITVDGKIVQGNAMQSSDLSELMLPVRSIAEALGAQVKWDSEHQAVLINSRSFPGTTHSSMHNHLSIVYNENLFDPDHDPVLQNGTVMLSSDALASLFQVSVKWNADKNKVQITTAEVAKQFNNEEQAVKDILNGVGMAPRIAAERAKEFTVTAEIHPWSPVKGVLTNAWTYNGQAPGPTIRVKEGDHVRVTLVNNLPEATTIHWHGLHVPIDMDGVPYVSQKPVSPGQSFTYDFIASHPGTFIYHSHFDDMKQIGNGL